jgi:membrane-bound serine protease (ClpP class)
VSNELHLIPAIADPNIALILIAIGALGVYAEMNAPGLIAPGVIGSLFVLFGIASLAPEPIDWRGAALIVIALVFFAFEAKLTSHGALTALGAMCMLIGSMMLVDSPRPELRIHWTTAAGITIPFALITSFLLSIALRARRNKVVTGPQAMLGLSGVSVEALNPSGTIAVRGEYWNASAPAHVDAGRPVRVTGVDGMALRVEAIDTIDTEEGSQC